MPDEISISSLSDDEVLALTDLQMDPGQSAELSELLALNGEGKLDASGRVRLDGLMEIYRAGMVRKSQALGEAVARGLKPPLGRV